MNRKRDIGAQVSAIQSRVIAVEKMQRDIQAEIDLMHAKISSDLNKQIQHKMDVLLGDELELSRQTGEIERLEQFLEYQINGDATNMLFNWSKHQTLLSELHDFKHFKNDLDVQLDLKVL